MAALDILVLVKVVTRADDIQVESPMSPGYIVTFILVFCNSMLAVTILSFVMRSETDHSYPSEDKWQ